MCSYILFPQKVAIQQPKSNKDNAKRHNVKRKRNADTKKGNILPQQNHRPRTVSNEQPWAQTIFTRKTSPSVSEVVQNN